MVSELEAGRVAEAAPGVEVVDPYALGLDELIARGMRWHDIDVELCSRAAARLEVGPPGRALRAAGGGGGPPACGRHRRRGRRARVHTAAALEDAAEIEGVRRAQAAADAGMSAAAGSCAAPA